MLRELSKVVCVLAALGLMLPARAFAQDDDYGELVQRNLELRQKIKALEDKYAALENERNVLILHVRDLQNDKDALGRKLEELVAGPGEIPKFISQNLKLNKSLEEAIARNSRLGKDMEDLNRQIMLLKGEKAEAFKMLEIERDDSAQRLQRAEEEIAAAQEALREYQALPLEQEEGVSAVAEKEEAAPAREVAVKEGAGSQPREAAAGREEFEKRLKDARRAFENEKKKLISQNEEFLKVLADQKASLEAELEQARRAGPGGKNGDKGAVKSAGDLEKAKKSFAARARKLEGDLAAARAVYAQKEQEWRQEKEDMVSRQKEAQRRSREIAGQKDAADKKAQKLEKDLETLTADISSLQEKLNAEKAAKKEAQDSLRKALAEKPAPEKAPGKKSPLFVTSAPSGKKRKAAADKAAVSRTNKQLLDMHYNLALAYNKTGMHVQERDEYLFCLKIDPKDASVHYNLAVLYDDNLNDNRKAIYHYRKYLELRPAAEDSVRVREWILHAEEEDRIGALAH